MLLIFRFADNIFFVNQGGRKLLDPFPGWPRPIPFCGHLQAWTKKTGLADESLREALRLRLPRIEMDEPQQRGLRRASLSYFTLLSKEDMPFPPVSQITPAGVLRTHQSLTNLSKNAPTDQCADGLTKRRGMRQHGQDAVNI